jgi:bacillithiol synthase
VISHCLPFRQLPHTTRLFLDYLEHPPSVEAFYPRSAHFLEWVKDESVRVQYPADRRVRIADLLERQNRTFGASKTALENIDAFRAGALAVVTGQQVGLFGGPVFSVYKALSAVKLAGEAKKLGINAVPIFWLATEDHDLDEVNQVHILGAEGFEKLGTSARAGEDAPVGTICFGPEISELVEQAKQLLGESEAAVFIEERYRPGENFGSAFAKLFARIFAEYGVIVLDASDSELDAIASPVYQEVIQRAPELNRILLQRDQELQAADYHQQVRVTDTSTPLFVIKDGARVPVQMISPQKFQIGATEVSQAELLHMAVSAPQSFSPNVLLRPIVQDYVLPTLTYIGGAAEVAYFAQAGALYEALAGRVTPVLPRFSATLVEPKPQALLEKYGLAITDVFQGVEALRERIGGHLLDSKVQASFETAEASVERTMTAVREALEQLDKTLVDSAKNAEAKMLHQLTTLRSRAARAELRQSEVAERHARLLSNALYPNKTLQEREYAGIYFLAKHGRQLLEGLLGVVNPECVDHQVVTL